MKEKVEKIEVEITPKHGLLRLSTKDKTVALSSLDPPSLINLSKLLSSEPAKNDDAEFNRLSLPNVLGSLMQKAMVREFYMHTIDEEHHRLLAEIDINGTKMPVSPTAGLLIAKLADAPIYIESGVCDRLAELTKSAAPKRRVLPS